MRESETVREDLWALICDVVDDAEGRGMRPPRAFDEGVRMHWDTQPRHLRPGGTVLGPILMTFADLIGWLSILAVREGEIPWVTSSMNLHFLAPARPGRINGEARRLKLTRHNAVIAIDIRDAEGIAVVHGTMQFAWSGGPRT